jgi:competence protein ComFA
LKPATFKWQLVTIFYRGVANMLSPKYYLYLALGSAVPDRIEISSNPRVDACLLEDWGYREMRIIQPPLPIWAAERVLAKVHSYPAVGNPSKFLKTTAQLIAENSPVKARQVTVQHHIIHELRLAEFDPPAIESLFWGRSLLGTEVIELLKNNGLSPWDPEDWMQYLWLQRRIGREASIGTEVLGIPVCRRCGSTSGITVGHCMFCNNSHCLTCTHCQTMGIAKSCVPLYFQPDPVPQEVSVDPIRPVFDFELTPPQQRASLVLEQFIGSEADSFLVWAVCGGGKTEVSFQAVAHSLSQGARVLYAIPRKEVVIELLPRFQKAFPDIEMSAQYGGSGAKFADTPLTMATTHQCLRYYRRFDLVILDEADAYPYQGSAMLQYAVKRALKENGRLIIMSATPDETSMHKAAAGKIPYVSIPARHHRQPLAVPEFVKLEIKGRPSPLSNWEPPVAVQNFLRQRKAAGRKVLVFLPTIQIIEELGRDMVAWAGSEGMHGAVTHSKSGNGSEVKTALLEGRLDFLVTSTIFERGITIPNVDVMVGQADYEMIFNSRSLIQIAGRAGRLGEPASVLFIGKSMTKSMKQAQQVITEMNREGFRLGFLDWV